MRSVGESLGLLKFTLDESEEEIKKLENERRRIRQDIRLINLLSNRDYKLNSAGYFYGYEDRLQGFKELFSYRECLKLDANINELKDYIDDDYIFRLKYLNRLLIIKESGIINPSISNGCEMILSSRIIPFEDCYLYNRYRYTSSDVDTLGNPIIKNTKSLALYTNQIDYPIVDYVKLKRFNGSEKHYLNDLLKEMSQEEIIDRILSAYDLDLGKLKEKAPKRSLKK